jgi:hypothetical protein
MVNTPSGVPTLSRAESGAILDEAFVSAANMSRFTWGGWTRDSGSRGRLRLRPRVAGKVSGNSQKCLKTEVGWDCERRATKRNQKRRPRKLGCPSPRSKRALSGEMMRQEGTWSTARCCSTPKSTDRRPVVESGAAQSRLGSAEMPGEIGTPIGYQQVAVGSIGTVSEAGTSRSVTAR